MTTPAVVVVAVAILDGTRVLAAQRSYPPELAGLWEFPGGKVDPGEGEAAAAVRECTEELGVVVRLEARCGPDVRTAAGHPLHLWSATIVAGEPHAGEHAALRWLTAGELLSVPWIPADLPLLAAVAARLGAVPTAQSSDAQSSDAQLPDVAQFSAKADRGGTQ